MPAKLDNCKNSASNILQDIKKSIKYKESEATLSSVSMKINIFNKFNDSKNTRKVRYKTRKSVKNKKKLSIVKE